MPQIQTPDRLVAGETPLAAATVADALRRTIRSRPDDLALRSMDGSSTLTWSELGERVRSIAAGLASLGVSKGDALALLLPNTVECHLIDYAALSLGAVPFTIYNSTPPAGVAHQLHVAGASVVVTEQQFLHTVLAAGEGLGDQVRCVVVTDGPAGTTTLATIESAGDPGFELDRIVDDLTPDDLVTMIFTSGTTGPPKGVEWSHRTVMAQQRAMAAAFPMPSEAVISFLPMAHAGGRTTCHYMVLAEGAAITACPDMTQVPSALRSVHPDAFFSTPRLWEKLQVAIETMIERESDPDRKAALRSSVATGLRCALAQDGAAEGGELTAELLDGASAAAEYLRPVLEILGLDRIKAAFVGGAPCTPEIVQFFRAVGVPLLEAYGLTEGSLNIFNQVSDFKTGTAGRPLPGVEVRTTEDGELLCRSELNMIGYRKEPDMTAATIDAEGWLHTGDIAVIDDDGYVAIVDRKKEIMISAAGKNMSPANIEAAIKGESSLIGQVVAIGDGRRYVTALITLDPEAVLTHASRLGLGGAAIADLTGSPEIRDELQAAVDRSARRLSSPERVRKFVVLPSVWVPDSDELTPTAKLKRKPIAAKYAAEIDVLYAD